MATIVIRKTVDDLDNTEDGVATTSFAFEGVTYEIDLATANYVKLREFLDPFIKAARRTGGRATGRRIMMPGQTTETVEKIGGNGNGNGHVDLKETRNFLTDIAAPQGKSQHQLIRHWYAQQSPEVQARLGKLAPVGSIRSNIVLAYQQAHGLAPADDQDDTDEPARESAADAAEVAEDSGAEKTAQPAAEAPQTTRTELLPAGQTETAMIRAWYAKQPYSWRATRPLKDRGRIPATIRDAYFRRGEKTQRAKIDA